MIKIEVFVSEVMLIWINLETVLLKWNWVSITHIWMIKEV